MNPDVIGWIYSPDTTINYPVVQGDDNAYYLKHLADGAGNRNGCPFLDVQNRPDFSDDNSIIYGHHMQNGTMFAGISWYEDQVDCTGYEPDEIDAECGLANFLGLVYPVVC